MRSPRKRIQGIFKNNYVFSTGLDLSQFGSTDSLVQNR